MVVHSGGSVKHPLAHKGKKAKNRSETCQADGCLVFLR